ncbi:hypothetical protein [Yokenella regensburgei]|uniref:hypothetical protein n=1 Tax=Yokenella regensburgei TaxID=158877 RepID=UPI00289A9520|nr:hypothetical protein [Yokenella regensburgei]
MKIMRRIIFLFLTMFCISCSAEQLMLYGGADHKEFLGCINCTKYDSGSICNKYGDQGSKYSDKSIWNRYGAYGSKYEETSPWNKFASNPPVIVDRNGGFYGFFTANKYQSKRTNIKPLLQFTDNIDWVTEDLERARDAFCGD